MSDVDFIVVTKDQLDFTRQCVESIFKNIRESFHLIIVDNGSCEDTLAYLTQLNERQSARQKVTVVLNHENLGYALGLNKGLEFSNAPYVFFCNNDIEIFDEAVTEMIRIANAKENFGLVNPNSNEFGLKGYDALFLNAQRGKWVERCHTSGFCVLVKREVIKKIKGIDPEFGPAYFEDMDFAERAKQAGFLCVVAKGAYIHHFGTRTFLAKEKQALWEKHKEKFIQKWGGTKWFLSVSGSSVIQNKSEREKLMAHLLQIARREIAILYIFVPVGFGKYFRDIHDSFRIIEMPDFWMVPAGLIRALRSRTQKPISKIFTWGERGERNWSHFKALHGAQVFDLSKEAIAAS